MLEIKYFNKFPLETKNKIIDMIFGANIPEELERIRKDILNRGEGSQYWNAVSDNVKLAYEGAFSGLYYNVNALVYVPSSVIHGNPEIDQS